MKNYSEALDIHTILLPQVRRANFNLHLSHTKNAYCLEEKVGNRKYDGQPPKIFP